MGECTSTPASATTWDSTTAHWSGTSGGPYNQIWAGGDAYFEGTAGSVTVTPNYSGFSTLEQTVAANSITFAVGGYSLGGGIIGLGDAGIFTSSATTLNCPVSCSTLAISGPGTLVLGSGGNQISKGVTIGGGTLQLADPNALQGGTLDYSNGTLSSARSLAQPSVDFRRRPVTCPGT